MHRADTNLELFVGFARENGITRDSRSQAMLVYISCKHCYISSLSLFPFPVLLDVSRWRTPNHSHRIQCCKLNYTVIHNAVQVIVNARSLQTLQHTL